MLMLIAARVNALKTKGLNLNTSHVNVNQDINCLINSLAGFKYISC